MFRHRSGHGPRARTYLRSVYDFKTLVFVAVCIAVLTFLPWITAQFFRLYGGRPSELETKYLLLLLFGLGALATWADSEAVLPAYLVGMILAGTVGKDHVLIRRHDRCCSVEHGCGMTYGGCDADTEG